MAFKQRFRNAIKKRIMNIFSPMKNLIIDSENDRFQRANNTSILIFLVLVILLMTKVLWGYWERDLTFGDTSYYYIEAVRWHLLRSVNIIWSPIYTAYYGYWLDATENAAIATFLHRIGLLIVTTGLVAWIGLCTLPRLFAFLLVCWWVALPIHYDTLYEVHLFGAIPMLVLALIALNVGEKWRSPLLLGVAVLATMLIRNEFILSIGVFLVLGFVNLATKKADLSFATLRGVIFRHAIVLLIVGLIVAFFYSASSIHGEDIKKASEPKHTLNMCQVYAFGYQQRNPEWKASPWTECSPLMQEKFGHAMPTLGQMLTANPHAVAEHFLWNLSLTRAGLEVLLFNATASEANPDYASVLYAPIFPSILLGLSIAIITIGGFLVYKTSPEKYLGVRRNIKQLAPVLCAAFIIVIAIILTQRPRPSYLLGAGVLYMWLVFSFLGAMTAPFKKMHSNLVFMGIAFALIGLIPSYKNLTYVGIHLPSKNGALGLMYQELDADKIKICKSAGKIALNEYSFELSSYLCSASWLTQGKNAPVIAFDSLGKDALTQPYVFAKALDAAGATTVIIDPFVFQKHPGLQGCGLVRDALLSLGWEQLAYRVQDDDKCIAAYIKP